MKLNKEEMGLHEVNNEQYSNFPKTRGWSWEVWNVEFEKPCFLHHACSFKYLHIPQT